MKEKLSFNGAIFDMDGVLTKTAKIHAKAWKVLFDDFLKVYPDALEVVKNWKGNMKLAVISSSKNCKHIMESAGILDFFDVLVDGVIAEKKKLEGKPKPDIFLEASNLMGIEPSHCLVFEDAIAGVEAGKKGRFGLVIGVARNGEQEALINSGADFVVESLENIDKKIESYA